MSMRLVPYAGTERPRLREPHNEQGRIALVQEITRRQQRGRLLSEIGDALGSREIVQAVLMRWLFEVPDA
jgi:hypothetical protein